MRVCSHGVSLVKSWVAIELALRVGSILVCAQHRGVKAAALHLHQLVNQYVTGGADFALEPESTAQQKRLAERAAVGEFGKAQVNAVNPFQAHGAGVRIIGKFNDI
jgi:hypothetical protein